MVATAFALFGAALSAPHVEWTQTAKMGVGEYDLGKKMPPLTLGKMAKPTKKVDKFLSIDRSQSFQEILGFGGAFTEVDDPRGRSRSRRTSSPLPRSSLCAKGGCSQLAQPLQG